MVEMKGRVSHLDPIQRRVISYRQTILAVKEKEIYIYISIFIYIHSFFLNEAYKSSETVQWEHKQEPSQSLEDS